MTYVSRLPGGMYGVPQPRCTPSRLAFSRHLTTTPRHLSVAALAIPTAPPAIAPKDALPLRPAQRRRPTSPPSQSSPLPPTPPASPPPGLIAFHRRPGAPGLRSPRLFVRREATWQGQAPTTAGLSAPPSVPHHHASPIRLVSRPRAQPSGASGPPYAAGRLSVSRCPTPHSGFSTRPAG